MRARTRLSLVLVMGLAALGVAGCGDDGGPSPGSDAGDDIGLDAGQADSSGDAAGSPGSSLGTCTLLETSEVEAQFDDVGPVSDGYEDMASCFWEVGEQEGFGSPEGYGDYVALNTVATDTSTSVEEAMEAEGGLTGESIDGIGDEAWLSDSMDMLVFQSGSRQAMLTTSLTSVEGIRDRLIALAEQIADRL